MDSNIATLTWNIEQLQLVRYFTVVIFTIFVVDYFHTLTREINSLWPAPWTVAKVLYLISRYSPFLDGPVTLAANSLSAPSIDTCIHLLRVEIWSGGIGETCSQVLLLFRVYALVGRTRTSAVLLSVLGFIMIALNFSFLPLVGGSIEATGVNIPSIFPKCSVGEANIVINNLMVVAPINIIVFETILFVVITWVKVKKYREDQNWLIRKIYRDAFLYYLLLLLVATASLIMWFATRGPIRQLSPTLARYFSSIITSRIILNIRQYGNRNGNSRTGSTSQPISQLRIASGSVTVGSSIGLGGQLY